jgi:catechol 2,3-dioxygenase-like lactoylglutathione lyase family enzyme
MRVHNIDHIVLNVVDVEQSLTWYRDVLGLPGDRVDEWRAGDAPFPSVRISETCLIDLFASERTGVNADHFCLVVDRADVEAVAADARFTVINGPVDRYGALGIGLSIYVTDPDDNVIELRSYD